MVLAEGGQMHVEAFSIRLKRSFQWKINGVAARNSEPPMPSLPSMISEDPPKLSLAKSSNWNRVFSELTWRGEQDHLLKSIKTKCRFKRSYRLDHFYFHQSHFNQTRLCCKARRTRVREWDSKLLQRLNSNLLASLRTIICLLVSRIILCDWSRLLRG